MKSDFASSYYVHYNQKTILADIQLFSCYSDAMLVVSEDGW